MHLGNVVVLAECLELSIEFVDSIFMGLSSKLGHSLRHLKTIIECCHTQEETAYSLLLPLFETFLSLRSPGPTAAATHDSRSFSPTSASRCRPVVVSRNCFFYLLSFQLQFLLDQSLLVFRFLLPSKCKRG